MAREIFVIFSSIVPACASDLKNRETLERDASLRISFVVSFNCLCENQQPGKIDWINSCLSRILTRRRKSSGHAFSFLKIGF